MQEITQNTILDKVKRLLSLAKSDNPHEADLALQKASALAVEHGIDLAIAQLDAANIKVEEKFEGEQTILQLGKRQPTIGKYVHWILESHFYVKLVFSGSREYGKRMSILGHKPDVETANYIYSYLLNEFDRRWDYYARSNSLGVKEKHTYLYSMYKGLDVKLTEAKNNAVTNRVNEIPEVIRQSASDKYAIILKDKTAKVHEFMYERFPNMKKAGKTSIFTTNNDKVRSDGFSSGYSMDISRPLAGQKCLN